jgi:lipoyl(octanoyl) transferase
MGEGRANERGEDRVAWVAGDESAFVDYEDAVAVMEAQARAIRNEGAPEAIWLVQHPPLYTAGTSARSEDLLAGDRFPVYLTGRGGQYTYHGPGQRVVYIMLDVRKRFEGVRTFVSTVEGWLIAALERFGVNGRTYRERVGVWVRVGDGVCSGKVSPGPAATSGGEAAFEEKKIAAIGIRLSQWVSLHGAAVNISPDLAHFEGIVPCGLADYGVTSLHDLDIKVAMSAFDDALRETFETQFGCRTVACDRLPLSSLTD